MFIGVDAVLKLLAQGFDLGVSHQGLEVAVDHDTWALETQVLVETLLLFLRQLARIAVSIDLTQLVKPTQVI